MPPYIKWLIRNLRYLCGHNPWEGDYVPQGF